MAEKGDINIVITVDDSDATAALKRQAQIARAMEKQWAGVDDKISKSFGKVAERIEGRIASAANAVKNTYDLEVKESKKAAKKFSDDWDAAHKENAARDKAAAMQAKYFSDLRANSQEKNAKDFSKLWDAAHKEDAARNKKAATQRAEEEARVLKGAQDANKARTEAFDKAEQARAKSVSSQIKKQFLDRFAAEDQITKDKKRFDAIQEKNALNSYAKINKASTAYWDAERQAGSQWARDSKAHWEQVVKHADGLDLSMPSLRYAMYDIANQAQGITTAIIGAGAAAIGFAAQYESAFTDVERTTLSSKELLGSVESQLLSLSETVPVAFSELSSIASLGAQLGVATGDLAGFASTVAEFSAVTNVSTDSAAQSFGALGELLNVTSDQYQNLGSSIAKVGVDSVATETEILSVATAIGGVANSAGLSADYVIGLSGALASLRVPAEQSRGALTRVFQEISRSASGTGVDIQQFANIMGISADEARNLATSNMEGFFTQFVQGLSNLDVTSLTNALDSLNLSDIRVTNTLTRLSRNTELVASTMEDASVAFDDGTFLSQVYALRVDDLASKLTILQNSAQNLGASVGSALEPMVKPIVDFITTVVQGFNSIAKTDAGGIFVRIAGGAAAFIAVLTGLISATATLVAGLGAVRFSLNTLGWSSASTGAKGFIASMFGVKAATDATSNSMKGFKYALISTGIGAIIALVSSLAAAMVQAADDSQNLFNKFFGDSAGLSDALNKDTAARNAALAAGNTELVNSFVAVEYAGTALNNKFGEQAQKVRDASIALGVDMPSALDYANEAVQQNTRYVGENTAAWAANVLQQNSAFQDLASQRGAADFLKTIGFNVQDFTAAAAEGEDAVQSYYRDLAAAALNAGTVTIDQVAAVDTALAASLINTNKNIGNSPATGFLEWGMNLISTIRQWIPFLGGYLDIVSDVLSGFLSWVSQAFGGPAIQFQTDSIEKGLGNVGKALADQIAIQELTQTTTDNTTDSFNNLGDSASGAAEKVYLLTDYANDLATIWERAKDIRFSGTETLDKVTSSFRKIAEATADALQQIQELNADIQSLNADKALQEYFLSVAEAYGDTLKAQELRANLAKIDADLTKKTKDLAKAQDKTNKTLIGSSDAAIENRSEILDLVSSYQDHVKALAASGMKEDELRAKTAQLKQDFIAQATQLGYNVDELGLYAVAFDDVRSAIDNVPRNVTVDFNGDPALTAIQEFAAKARAAIAGASGTVTPSFNDAELKKAARGAAIQASIQTLLAQISQGSVSVRQKVLWTDKVDELKNLLNSGAYATGGYVSGPGGPTSDSINARLSNGEYVIKAAAVNKYGIGFFDRLNQMQTPHYASGGAVTPASTGMVSLSPEDRALLRNIGGTGEVVLYANNEALARSVNAGNKSIVAAGGRP